MVMLCSPISSQSNTKAALAHLGERQTEDNFSSDIWRHCVRSTEAAICESRITSIKNTIFFCLFAA